MLCMHVQLFYDCKMTYTMYSRVAQTESRPETNPDYLSLIICQSKPLLTQVQVETGLIKHRLDTFKVR